MVEQGRYLILLEKALDSFEKPSKNVFPFQFSYLPPDLVKEKVSFVCFSVFNPFPTLSKLLLRKGTQASVLEHFIGSIGTEYVCTFLFLLHFEIIIYLW